MTRRLFNPGPSAAILAKLHSRPRLLVFDFDGTLAPIAATPAAARLRPRMRRLLGMLARSGRTTVAVVSGRGLNDLRRKVGLAGVIYLGNHGLTASRPGLGMPPAQLRAWTRAAQAAQRALEPLLGQYPGSLLEMKGPDISLHYRRVASGRVPSLLRRARLAISGLPFQIRPGKKVMELRPADGGDKGTALERLAAAAASGWRQDGLCLFIGDDRTDEDAFEVAAALGPRALGIKVGPGKTRAGYRLVDDREVEKFIRWAALAVPE